jgi:hypothetical protein
MNTNDRIISRIEQIVGKNFNYNRLLLATRERDEPDFIACDCGEPTKDGEKCGECKASEAEHRMEMDI